MHNKFFSRNIFNKYLIGGILIVFAVLTILLGGIQTITQSDDVAFAENTIPNVPTVKFAYGIKQFDVNGNLRTEVIELEVDTLKPKKYGFVLGGMGLGNCIIDAYESNWREKILEALIIKVDFQDYNTKFVTTSYQGGAGTQSETTTTYGVSEEGKIDDKFLSYKTQYTTSTELGTIKTTPFFFMDGYDEDEYVIVKDIGLIGTTWYGEPLETELSATNIPAGKYEISSISIEYKLSVEYIESVKTIVYDAQSASPQVTSTSNKKTITLGEDEIVQADYINKQEEGEEISEFNKPYILVKSHISVDLGDAGNRNLYLDDVVYNPNIQWGERVGLYEPDGIGDGDYYFFSYKDRSNKVFYAKYGYYADRVPQNNTVMQLDLHNTTVSGEYYYEHLILSWYKDINKEEKIDIGDTVNAGTYYLSVEVIEEEYSIIPLENGSNVELFSIVDNANPSQDFIYEFKVDKKELKVDIEINQGAKIDGNTVPFSTSYTRYTVPIEFENRKIQEVATELGVTFYVGNAESGEEIIESVKSGDIFDLKKNYYIDNLDASSMLRTSIFPSYTLTFDGIDSVAVYSSRHNRSETVKYTVTNGEAIFSAVDCDWNCSFQDESMLLVSIDNGYDVANILMDKFAESEKDGLDVFAGSWRKDNPNDSAIWEDMGGYIEDFVKIGEKLFSFNGSYFVAKTVGKHEEIIMFLQIENENLYANYKIDLGQYQNGNWISYAENSISDTNTYLLKEYHNATNNAEIYVYRYYHQYFEILPPVVKLNFEEFVSENYYGTTYYNSDIDYNGIFLEDCVEEEGNGVYNVITSESNWYIKIMSNSNDVETYSATDNYVYVYMTVANSNEDPTATNFNFDGMGYEKYAGALYAGEYYVIYEPYVRFAGETASALLKVDNGECTVKNTSDEIVFSLKMQELVYYFINQLDIYITVVDYRAEKTYDGTDIVWASDGNIENNKKAVLELRVEDGHTLSDGIKKEDSNINNILEYDLKYYISFTHSLVYVSMMASEDNILIMPNVEFSHKEGQDVALDEIESKIGSYNILGIKQDTEQESQELYGKINYRYLDIQILTDPDKVVDPDDPEYSEYDYSRNYGEDTYVAFRVAKYSDVNSQGKTLTEKYVEELGKNPDKEHYADYYYYCDQTTGVGGYYFYSELPEIWNGRCYVFLTIASTNDIDRGLLNGESFNWDNTRNYTSSDLFNYNKNTFALEIFRTQNLVIWKDIYDDIEINSLTASNNSDKKCYTLGLNVGDFSITNYKIASIEAKDTFTFEIFKIELAPEEVFDFRGSDLSSDRYLVYTGEDNINSIFTNDDAKTFINIQKHPEYSIILDSSEDCKEGQFKEFLKVISFAFNYYEDEALNVEYSGTELKEKDEQENGAISKIVWAGLYTFMVTIPETDNYRSVTGYHTIAVDPAEVTVYATVAKRVYMSEYDARNEVKLATEDASIKLTQSELDLRKRYINRNTGEIFEENEGGICEEIYVYFDDNVISTNYIHIYFVGMLDSDTLSVDINELFKFNHPYKQDADTWIDAAGRYDKTSNGEDVISIGNINMRNYTFNYNATPLYVIKQKLNLDIDFSQEITYTGKDIIPDYTVFNDKTQKIDDATIKAYVAAYYDVDGNIYIKDYSQNPNIIKPATIATDYNNLQDYYFYFLNDDDEQIYIYFNGNYFYYENNDTSDNSNIRIISESFNLSFVGEDNEDYDGYVAKIANLGKNGKIYLVIKEHENAFTDDPVQDVFYYYDEEKEQDVKGGYIFKTYATPPSSGNSNNYDVSETKQVFVNVNKLVIELQDLSETIDGITINPIVSSEYTGAEYKFDDFNVYFTSNTLDNEGNLTNNVEYYWGKIEYAISADKKQIYYYEDESRGNFETSYLTAFANRQGDGSAFETNANEAINAGLYIIKVKATISDGKQFASQYYDMRKNICFSSTLGQNNGEDTTEIEFLLYLVMNRSGDIELSAVAAGGLRKQDINEDDVEALYKKTYDGEKISMGVNLKVSSDDSSKGEILSIKAYVSTEKEGGREDYFKSEKYSLADTSEMLGTPIPEGIYYEFEDDSYSLTTDTFFESGTQYYKKSHRIDYSIYRENASKISLVNHNEFYVIYVANPDDIDDYNNNFVTVQKIYKVIIEQKALIVNIECKEGEESSKNFGERNCDVEYKFKFSYSGWVNEDDKNELEPKMSSQEYDGSPVIDWRNVRTDDDLEGVKMPYKLQGYLIYAKDDPNGNTYVPSQNGYTNYAFNYDSSSKTFMINKLQFVIGGNEYPRVDIQKSAEYNGNALIPEVICRGYDQEILYDPANGINNEVTVEINLLGKLDSGMYDGYTQEQLKVLNLMGVKVALGIGYYLFEITIAPSTNYEYVSENGDNKYLCVFEITKAILVLEFINESGQVSRGRESDIYTGDSIVYPSYNVKYTGFRGNDDNYNGMEQQISFFHYSNSQHVVVNKALGLINPYYVFVDINTGKELIDSDGNPVMPTEQGMYYIKIIYNRSENGYGIAENYYIEPRYLEENGDILYPEFCILPRPVTVRYDPMQNTKITKTYDGTYAVIPSTFSPSNYTFTKVTGETKSGLIEGDEITIVVDFTNSMYARRTVYDSLGIMSDIEVYLSVSSALEGPDASNYIFTIDDEEDNAYVAMDKTYLKLYGMINPASATVRFYKDGQVMTNRITEVYDGLPKPVSVTVTGVNGEILTLEGGGYTMKYVSELSNYDREEAPSNCDTYIVTVVITDMNYIPTSNSIDLVVGQAEVEINFGGDGIQIYGDVTVGLSATAISVNYYRKDLTVSYYYYNEDGTQGALIEDISKAPVGVYIVEAIHNETTNYGYKRDMELLTIVRREVQLNYDVANHYKYNEQQVEVLMYFIDGTTRYYPQLMFDSIVDGKATPYNYTFSEDGTVTNVTARHPIDAGQYRVKAYEEFGNYIITDAIWCDFEIQKADMVVSVADVTIDEGDPIQLTLILVGNLTSASASSILSGVQYKYYDAVSGAEISGEPTVAGDYKVICYGASAKNYNLSYSFGILKINKVVLETTVQGSNSQGEQKQVVMEGSFSSNMSVTVNKKQNTEYVDMVTTYQSYVENNPDLGGYKLSDVYVFEYVNYVPSAIRGNVVIKIHSKDIIKLIQDSQKNDASTDGDSIEQLKFNIALLDADGNFTIVEGYQDGDYICFETTDTQIKAVSILMDETIVMDDTLDWLLYVGIVVAVLLIGIAIVIVVKRS